MLGAYGSVSVPATGDLSKASIASAALSGMCNSPMMGQTMSYTTGSGLSLRVRISRNRGRGGMVTGGRVFVRTGDASVRPPEFHCSEGRRRAGSSGIWAPYCGSDIPPT